MYNLPHPLDRPGQLEAFEWLMASKKKYNIICAPTGSGKSAWPAKASMDCKVMVLTQTKSLQAENYAGTYSFDPLYGKSNYPCKDESKLPLQWTASDCDISDCNCPYQSQVVRCINSPRSSLNYAKYLSSKRFVQAAQPEILFLDEAHNMPDITIEHIGLTLRWDNEFVQHETTFKEAMPLKYPYAMSLFKRLREAIIKHKPDKKVNIKQWRKWNNLARRIDNVSSVIGQSSYGEWFYEADEEKLTIKPLTAKYHFSQLFDAPKLVLMSATIKPSIAKRLGIDDMAFYELDSVWPIPTRIIYDLNAPAINYNSPDEDKQRQAELIASVLCKNKSGIIHVSSKSQAKELRHRLKSINPQLLINVPEIGIGTDKQLSRWNDIRKPGLYCISWCFHEGVDLGDDDIGIMAKVPFPSLSSNYDQAKQKTDRAWYSEKTAYLVEQLFGRIQRGHADHYNGSKLMYIADGSWKMKSLMKYYSLDFMKRIRSYNGK